MSRRCLPEPRARSQDSGARRKAESSREKTEYERRRRERFRDAPTSETSTRSAVAACWRLSGPTAHFDLVLLYQAKERKSTGEAQRAPSQLELSVIFVEATLNGLRQQRWHSFDGRSPIASRAGADATRFTQR